MRETLTDSKLEILRRNRVDRISMGVQSSQSHFLDLLGRGYRIDEPLEVIRTIKSAGFEVNIDMMYRLPGQGRAEVAEDVDAVRWLGIDHLSWFPYVPHGNTPLACKIELGKVAPHADRREYLEMYKLVAERMGEAGYQHYTPYYFAARRRCEHHVGRWRLPQVCLLYTSPSPRDS